MIDIEIARFAQLIAQLSKSKLQSPLADRFDSIDIKLKVAVGFVVINTSGAYDLDTVAQCKTNSAGVGRKTHRAHRGILIFETEKPVRAIAKVADLADDAHRSRQTISQRALDHRG